MSAIWRLSGQDWFLFLGGFVGVGLGILPVLHHLVFGLRERRREILNYFQPRSILLYIKQFYSADWSSLKNKSDEEIVGRFQEMYDSRFGVRTFLIPSILYSLALIGLVSVIAFAIGYGSVTWSGAALETKGLYALAGAYLWVVLDLISRYRQRNLVPSALYGYTSRFIFSIPLAYAISTFFVNSLAPPIAFALGAFPTETLMVFLRRQGAQRMGLSDDTTKSNLELESLQGVNTALAEKFGEIGIMTMLQLAYEDPIQLTMRTNLSFNFIIDVVSQALATIYGLDLTKTRTFSVRGAFEAAEIFEHIQVGDKEAKLRADVVVTQLAAKFQVCKEIVLKILSDVHEDPYTQFLRQIWVEVDQPGQSGNHATATGGPSLITPASPAR